MFGWFRRKRPRHGVAPIALCGSISRWEDTLSARTLQTSRKVRAQQFLTRQGRSQGQTVGNAA